MVLLWGGSLPWISHRAEQESAPLPHGSGSCFALAQPNYDFKVLRFAPPRLGVRGAERVLSFLGRREGGEPLPIWNRVGFLHLRDLT